jgi:uncharacterized protein (TIGR02266 family)
MDSQPSPSAADRNESLLQRRRHERAHLVTELNWFSGSNFYTGFTQDISEGGVFIVSYLSEPVGTEVTLDLGFTGGLEIHAKGIVRWVRDPRHISDESEPPGMGIQFIGLSDRDRAIINSYVAHRDPLFYDDGE